MEVKRLISFNAQGQAVFHKDENGEEEKAEKEPQ